MKNFYPEKGSSDKKKNRQINEDRIKNIWGKRNHYHPRQHVRRMLKSKWALALFVALILWKNATYQTPYNSNVLKESAEI